MLAAISLAGCATQAILPSKAKPVPVDRIYQYQNRTDQNNSTLIVVRDSGMVGSACYATIYINGGRVAKLETQEKATFFLPSGEWSIGTNLEGRGLCSAPNDRQERYISLKNGESKSVRIFTDGSGNMDIKPTTLN